MGFSPIAQITSLVKALLPKATGRFLGLMIDFCSYPCYAVIRVVYRNEGSCHMEKSFSDLERELEHAYRNNMNHAESVADVEKFFSYITRSLLTQAFPELVNLDREGIKFDRAQTPAYSLSRNLKENPSFQEIWKNSDLPNIVSRFANTALHRHRHLIGNPAKSNRKLRHHS